MDGAVPQLPYLPLGESGQYAQPFFNTPGPNLQNGP